MDDNRDLLSNNRYGIFTMCLYWIVSTGALAAAILLSLALNPRVYPLACLALCIGVYAVVIRNRHSSRPVCALLPFITAKTLLWSAIIMMILNMMHSNDYIKYFVADITHLNPKLPYIPVLILAPVMTVISAWAYFRGRNQSFCRECQRRNGIPAERGYLGPFYSREGHFQVSLMLLLSVAETCFSVFYYLFFYINVNFNSPDRFNFVYAPVALLVASMIYVYVRHQGLWLYFMQNFQPDYSTMGRSSQIRFLIISGDEILLRTPHSDDERAADRFDPRYDTPVTIRLRRQSEVTLDEAMEYFTNMTDIPEEYFEMRFLYANSSEHSASNIFHFLVVLKEKDDIEGSRIAGQWYDIKQLAELINAQKCVPLLSIEIIRLVKMTKAWKTYTPEGERRNPIKNYHPAFHLSDLANMDINFSDLTWLHVADLNADKPFFKLRRFWSRHVSRSDS